MDVLEILASVFLVAGGVFCLIAGIGVVRLGDVFMRMHASTKAGTLGIALISLAMILLARDVWELVEPAFVFLFMVLTIPIGSHLIGRAAFRTRVPMQENTRVERSCEAFRSAHPYPRTTPRETPPPKQPRTS